MPTARSRFSHRHLLALCTFLVPLAFLAALGWSELQRSGAATTAAIAREGKQLLTLANQTIERRIDRLVSELMRQTRQDLRRLEPIRMTLELQSQPDFAAVRSIVLLDEQGNVVHPALPLHSIYLPMMRPRTGSAAFDEQLQKIDLLLTKGEWTAGVRRLQQLIEKVVRMKADMGGFALSTTEATARLRLATVLRKLRQDEAARDELQRIQALATNRTNANTEFLSIALAAELMQAEMGTVQDRRRLLREIAENRREEPADGLLTAMAQRLAASLPPDDLEVQRLLSENDCRAAIISFAEQYEQGLKWDLRRQRQATTGESPADDAKDVERLVSPLDEEGRSVLLCVRPATPEEALEWRCASVAIEVDLNFLLAPIGQQFRNTGGGFVLAVHDPFNYPILKPPPSPPHDFDIATLSANDLTLSAHPVDPGGMLANEEASVTNRSLLLLALFVTALGGALWSWRSVSREADLAALKVDLVSRVSHELKTPLALVRMYGETLSMGRARDGNEAAEFGAIIARESERLTTLINRILDFSRQQAGTLDYSPAVTDLSQLLRDVVEAYSPHLQSRGALLVDSIPFGILVHCDANACESAVVNLLENAAKYGVEGNPEHEIDLVLERRGDHACIEVRDRGRGIPPAELTRVFDGFYRASNSGEVRGAGLGLSLVRHFARAHGGDIQAMPREGGGTVMRLTLPLAPAPADAPAGSPAAKPQPTG